MLVLDVHLTCLSNPDRLPFRSDLPIVLARRWQPAPASLCSVRYLTLACRVLVLPRCRQLPTMNRRNLGSTYDVKVNVTLPRVHAFLECLCLEWTLTVPAPSTYLDVDREKTPWLDRVKTVVVVLSLNPGPDTPLYASRNETALDRCSYCWTILFASLSSRSVRLARSTQLLLPMVRTAMLILPVRTSDDPLIGTLPLP